MATHAPIVSRTRIISIAPTVDTSAYATGDLVGPKQTLTSAGIGTGISGTYNAYSGVIQSLTITDLAKQSANFDIVIFNANPASTTFTDNAAFAIADADLPKVVGVIQVTNQVTFADSGVGIATSCGLAFDAVSSSGILYAAAVIRSTATFAASDLTFRYGILQD